MKRYIHFLYVASVCLFASCGRNEPENASVHYTIDKGIISLSDSSNIRAKLTLDEVRTQLIDSKWQTVGTVRIIPNSYAEIAAPFSGRVLESHVTLGQQVQPGQAVFSIHSVDFNNSQREHLDAKQEFRQAELNLARQRDLLTNGVGVQREVEEAETIYNIAQSALYNAESAIKIFNIDPSRSTLGQPLVIRSPIGGEVITNDIVIGQYLKEDAEPLVKVAALGKVWVEAQVKERDVNRINNIKKVSLHTPAFPDNNLVGSVRHINEIVDEDTRSIQVLVEVNNKERHLKPGMFVTVDFGSDKSSIITIPNTAVMQAEEYQFVFTEIGKNQYKAQRIEILKTENGNTVVKDGLEIGDKIIIKGGIYLLSSK